MRENAEVRSIERPSGRSLHGPLSALARGVLEKFVALVELSNDFIAMARLDQSVEYVNAAGRRLVGIDPDEDVTQYTIADFLTPEGLSQSVAVEQPAVREHGWWQGESTLRDFRTGEGIPVAINSFLVVHPDTHEPMVLATVQRDIRAQKATERELRDLTAQLQIKTWRQQVMTGLSTFAITCEIEDLYARVISELADIFAGADVELHLWKDDVLRLAGSSANHAQAGSESDGFVREAAKHRHPTVSSCTSRVAAPILGRANAGGVLALKATGAGAFSDDDAQFLAGISAILAAAAARQDAEMALQFDALHDPLTQLPNRSLMLDRLEHALARARRSNTHVAVVLLDLDNFKMVNDSFGHRTGDELLQAFAPRLRMAVRSSDTVARLGGDEFVVICEGIVSEDEALGVAADIRKAWSEVFEVDHSKLFVAASTGVAVSSADGSSTAAEMLREADTAMYRAKQRRLGGIEIYSAKMHSSIARNLQLATELQEAIESNAIVPAYEPIVDTRTGEIVAVEALARWKRAGELVPASEFIEIAERSGLILSLGSSILERSCNDFALLHRRHPERTPVGLRVNVSVRQLLAPHFVDDVKAILERTGFPPSLLGLEITEAVLIEDHELAEHRFRQITALGIGLLLDDFGTGYSSLLYLRNFAAVSTLKIDRSFVQGILDVETDATIVSMIATLAGAFGMEIVAEGVETEAHFNRVRDLGCHYAQGHFLGRAAPLPALEHAIYDAHIT